MKHKILITGSHGMLWSTFRNTKTCEHAGYEVIYADRDILDITDLRQCEDFFDQNTITIIINCAAYTNVEHAEDEGKMANYVVNTLGPTNLALCAKKHSIHLIHISTDYVFDGTRVDGNNEYDTCWPLSAYGLAKWLGEEAILRIHPDNSSIIRTSRLYGWWKEYKNFVNTMMMLWQSKPELRVIADQRWAPTYTNDLMDAILQVIRTDDRHQSIYHFCNKAPEWWITRYDFACKIFSLTDNPIPVHPIPSSDYPTKAVRPRHSHLINNSEVVLRDWEEALEEYLSNMWLLKNQ